MSEIEKANLMASKVESQRQNAMQSLHEELIAQILVKNETDTENERKARRCIIHPQSTRKLCWDVFIAL